jgi:type IV pilus assembly protein PilC
VAVYEYIARDENGSKFSGTYSDIDSIAMLREELAKMGYALLRSKRKRSATKKRAKIKHTEVVTFAYNFAGMISAGLPIAKCLETIEEQTENQSFKDVISDVRQGIETGLTLKNAFGKHRNIFSDFFLGMLEAGESGGKLSETLEMSADYLEKQADIKRRVRSALAYPIVVCIMCCAIVVSLVIFVIPVFSKLYQQMHISLPGATRVLVDLSNLVRDRWWVILLGIAGLVLLLRHYSKNPYLKAKWDEFKLNMPMFAKLNRMVVVSRFIRTFAMLVSTGVPLVEALDVASSVAHNSKVSEIAGQLQRSIEVGNPVASSLKNYDIFPPMIVQLAASGEEAGTLPKMLNKGVDFIDKDIDKTINVLLVRLEPALVVITGIIVGFILISAYLPMFDYIGRLK